MILTIVPLGRLLILASLFLLRSFKAAVLVCRFFFQQDSHRDALFFFDPLGICHLLFFFVFIRTSRHLIIVVHCIVVFAFAVSQRCDIVNDAFLLRNQLSVQYLFKIFTLGLVDLIQLFILADGYSLLDKESINL